MRHRDYLDEALRLSKQGKVMHHTKCIIIQKNEKHSRPCRFGSYIIEYQIDNGGYVCQKPCRKYAVSVPSPCRHCGLVLALAETEVVASVVPVFAALPAEFPDGDAEISEVRHISSLQVVLQLFLNGCGSPERVGKPSESHRCA